MFNLLIDTCVWLDLAKDHKQQALLGVLEDLIESSQVSLIVPQLIIDEFNRNKSRIVEESRQSISSTFKRVKGVVDRFGDPKRKRSVLEQLDEIDHKLPTLGDSAIESIGRMEGLFGRSAVFDVSDPIKLRAAQRAIDGKAPFHRQKNSINDSILIEVYCESIQKDSAKGDRFAFVTHNIKDFSTLTGDTRQPHPDIAGNFSRIKSLYFTSLGTALQRIAPELVSDKMIEEEWHQESRRLSEILEAEDLLHHQVWYNRHHLWRHMVETGRIEIVEKVIFPVKDQSERAIQRDVWEGALKAAARVEKTYGKEKLGPWSDFEWGMINGKLSALRWVLGDEWDMLDT